jgi:isocitrate/isopropylmalate dehydrogenase
MMKYSVNLQTIANPFVHIRAATLLLREMRKHEWLTDPNTDCVIGRLLDKEPEKDND